VIFSQTLPDLFGVNNQVAGGELFLPSKVNSCTLKSENWETVFA